MLESLDWPLLEARRKKRDLEMFPASTRGHKYKFRQLSPSVNAFKHSFFVRTIPQWKILPTAAVEADGLASFRAAS